MWLSPCGRATQWFIVCCGLILFITGLAEARRASRSSYVLGVADPSFRVLFRQLMVGVGCLELFIAFFRLFTAKRQFRLLAVA